MLSVSRIAHFPFSSRLCQQQHCLFWAHLQHIIERDNTSDFFLSLRGSSFSTSITSSIVIGFHSIAFILMVPMISCSTLISFQNEAASQASRTCGSHFLSDRHKFVGFSVHCFHKPRNSLLFQFQCPLN